MKASNLNYLIALKKTTVKLGEGEKNNTVIQGYLNERRIERALKRQAYLHGSDAGELLFTKTQNLLIELSCRTFSDKVFKKILEEIPEENLIDLFSTNDGRTYLFALFRREKEDYRRSKERKQPVKTEVKYAPSTEVRKASTKRTEERIKDLEARFLGLSSSG